MMAGSTAHISYLLFTEGLNTLHSQVVDVEVRDSFIDVDGYFLALCLCEDNNNGKCSNRGKVKIGATENMTSALLFPSEKH